MEACPHQVRGAPTKYDPKPTQPQGDHPVIKLLVRTKNQPSLKNPVSVAYYPQCLVFDPKSLDMKVGKCDLCLRKSSGEKPNPQCLVQITLWAWRWAVWGPILVTSSRPFFSSSFLKTAQCMAPVASAPPSLDVRTPLVLQHSSCHT